jgi:hypothetical protein
MEPIDEKIVRTTADICGAHSAAAQAINDAERKRPSGLEVAFLKAGSTIIVASRDTARG